VNACRVVATSHNASVATTRIASATVLAVISAITPATRAVAPSTLAKLTRGPRQQIRPPPTHGQPVSY
jgi:hypothetical protein